MAGQNDLHAAGNHREMNLTMEIARNHDAAPTIVLSPFLLELSARPTSGRAKSEPTRE